MMKLEVTTPEEYLGDVMGDISRAGGKVQGMESRPGVQVVDRQRRPWRACSAMPPICVSSTQGRATFSMEFSHYEPLPASLAQEVMEKAKAEREASQRGWPPRGG
jgi:elongation factor G